MNTDNFLNGAFINFAYNLHANRGLGLSKTVLKNNVGFSDLLLVKANYKSTVTRCMVLAQDLVN